VQWICHNAFDDNRSLARITSLTLAHRTASEIEDQAGGVDIFSVSKKYFCRSATFYRTDRFDIF
jgi:hypothetical protein